MNKKILFIDIEMVVELLKKFFDSCEERENFFSSWYQETIDKFLNNIEDDFNDRDIETAINLIQSFLDRSKEERETMSGILDSLFNYYEEVSNITENFSNVKPITENQEENEGLLDLVKICDNYLTEYYERRKVDLENLIYDYNK